MVSAASWRKIGLRGMTGHNSYNVVIPIFFETVPVYNKKYFYLHNKMVYAFLINYAIQNYGSIQEEVSMPFCKANAFTNIEALDDFTKLTHVKTNQAHLGSQSL